MTALVFLVGRYPGSALVRRFAAAIALGYLLASVYIVPELAARLLTLGLRPLQATDLPPGPMTIVILGAGSTTVHDWDDRRFVSPDPHAAARALEGARVFRMAPSATVISSGGLLTPDAPGTPTGEAMAIALRQMGVPGERVVVETESRNTHGEAVVIARMLRDRSPGPIVLVTTDVHMRRSIGTFAAEGLRVIPAIAQSPDRDLPRHRRWLPSSEGLAYSGFIVHEVLGIGYYAVRGWFVW